MTLADYEAKIKASEERVEKIKKTIERHKAQRAKKITALDKILSEAGLDLTYEKVKDTSGWYYAYRDQPYYNELSWTSSDIEDKDSAIRDNEEKLKKAEEILETWKKKRNSEKAKLQYIEDSIPEVIKQFLLEWKNRIAKYIEAMRESYPADRKHYLEEVNKIYYRYMKEHEEDFSWIDLSDYNPDENYRHKVTSYKHAREIERGTLYMQITAEFEGQYGDPLFIDYKSRKFDTEWLDQKLTEIMNDKLVELMQRVGKVTGRILDANLHIEKGDLNGTIYGEDGDAQVTTIGAGGYNIQRYHFRVLVKPLKK